MQLTTEENEIPKRCQFLALPVGYALVSPRRCQTMLENIIRVLYKLV